jgi:RNA polymerase sigma factor (sigma-70 family)
VRDTPTTSDSRLAPLASERLHQPVFLTTRWSVVLTAARSDTPHARAALATLCQTYWQPLYAYVRRHSRSKEDAEDLVQGFFAQFLAGNKLEGLSSEQGHFRAFLLASLKHFMANEWDRAHRQKRGGHATHFSLDWQHAENRYQLDPADHLSPDRLFDREWAMALLARVLARLGEESAAEGRAEVFERLKIHLMADRDAIPYGKTARDLGMEEGAARVAVHRLRKRYRALVREEIVQTLSSPEQVDEEMRALFAALAG